MKRTSKSDFDEALRRAGRGSRTLNEEVVKVFGKKFALPLQKKAIAPEDVPFTPEELARIEELVGTYRTTVSEAEALVRIERRLRHG